VTDDGGDKSELRDGELSVDGQSQIANQDGSNEEERAIRLGQPLTINSSPINLARTAIVMPIYNEDAERAEAVSQAC